MDLIAELEKLVTDWKRTDQAGGGCPGCQNRKAQVSELLSAAKQEPGLDKPFASFCPDCGPNVYIDEDGCCSSCGSTAIGDGLSRLNERIQALIRPAPARLPDGGLRELFTDEVQYLIADFSQKLIRSGKSGGRAIQRFMDAFYAALTASIAGERPEHPKLSIAIQEGYEPDAPPLAPAGGKYIGSIVGTFVPVPVHPPDGGLREALERVIVEVWFKLRGGDDPAERCIECGEYGAGMLLDAVYDAEKLLAALTASAEWPEVEL